MKSFFVARKKFQKSCFLSDFSRNKALKSLFFGILQLLHVYSCTHLYIYTCVHVHMTNNNESCIFLIASTLWTQLKSCYFCTEVFIYEYLRTKNSNFLLQDFQRLNYLCRTTKNRFNPDICNFIADYGIKSCFYICLRLLLSIN